MARKRGRRSKPFKVNLKQETTNTILAILIIAIGGLISISFSRQGVVLDTIFSFGTGLLGWTLILVPFLFISGGLMLTKVSWGISKPNVFLGTLVMLVSLCGLTRAGNVGQQLFISIESLITPAGSILFYMTGMTIGAVVLFETSLEDISLMIANIFKFIKKSASKASGITQKASGMSLPSMGGMKVRGLENDDDYVAVPQKHTQTQEDKKIEAMKINENNRNLGTDAVTNKPGGKTQAWELPPVSLLSDKRRGKADRGDVNGNAATIKKTLESFGIQADVVEVNCGPAVTQYALKIALGTKLSKISALQSDLALALAAPQGQIRIEAPIPGRSLVGIEIPNRSLEFVPLRNILTSETMKKHQSRTAVALGIDVAGEASVADITKMPHVLIAGSTGSGKSVCLNSFIISILMRSNPDEVKFIMVDPKRVELTGYNGIPHLLTPVIVDPEKVVSALRWAIVEMEKRYKLYAEVGVRNIASYNELSGFQAMPYIVIIIDELADIMLFAPSEVEDSITRIAQMARAVGIHLVLATQRPSVDVITGLIKANIPCRIAFNVASMTDSRVILDTPGAEKLLGKGDMLYIPPDQAKPRRIQGCFLEDAEINDIIKHLRSSGVEPEYQKEVTESVSPKARTGVSGQDLGDVDDLFDEAAKICIETKKASASLLQRRLSIGYARAARVLDQLENAGIVSAQDGSKAREILISDVSQISPVEAEGEE
jgi:DNA segregation ATPase FtsK/SpoIIIE, S-DNA-T family